MKNKLLDLNNHLFEQIERLNDEELSGEELKIEIQRAKAISTVATNIINNASIVLEAQKFYGKQETQENIPELLQIKNK